jgi:DNA-binding MarR family transcriptional regulator
MKKYDFSHRFGFLVNEVGRLYGRLFDQLARERLGISRAQIRLISVVATAEGDRPWTQAELAQRLDLTPMGVATLCDRMEAGGWLRRTPSPNDRRANAIELEPKALDVLDEAIELSDDVQSAALAGLAAAERKQLVALLQRVRTNLQAPAAAVAGSRT